MLTFDPASHTYTLNNIVVPSVTQVLSPLYNFGRIPKAVMEAKRHLGTAVHACCELIDQNDLDEDSVCEEWKPYVEAYRMFIADFNPEWELIEHKVFHSRHLYAGTLDRYGVVRGENVMVDLKTSVEVYPPTGPQTAAYVDAAKDMGLIRANRNVKRYALQLKNDGTYNYEALDDPLDKTVFLSLLTIRNYILSKNIDASIYKE